MYSLGNFWQDGALNDTVDANGKVLPSANAWAQQFYSDIESLSKLDAGQGLLDLLQDRVVSVFTEFLPQFSRRGHV